MREAESRHALSSSLGEERETPGRSGHSRAQGQLAARTPRAEARVDSGGTLATKHCPPT